MNQEEMNIDQINDAHESALSALRERIRAKQASVFETDPLDDPFPIVVLELQEVPEVVMPDESEFSFERYAEITFKLETLYNNYLYRVKRLKEEPQKEDCQVNYEDALKALCRACEQLLKEGLKPRF